MHVKYKALITLTILASSASFRAGDVPEADDSERALARHHRQVTKTVVEHRLRRVGARRLL